MAWWSIKLLQIRLQCSLLAQQSDLFRVLHFFRHCSTYKCICECGQLVNDKTANQSQGSSIGSSFGHDHVSVTITMHTLPAWLMEKAGGLLFIKLNFLYKICNRSDKNGEPITFPQYQLNWIWSSIPSLRGGSPYPIGVPFDQKIIIMQTIAGRARLIPFTFWKELIAFLRGM